ncbi:hypothetical protein DSO57_1028899 [Entomophthora muscae]|uniref:Uncharacterized protein n=1 Tax=Entomophthora muscae TaxID=34485 RepID=A0ACC2T1E3_9FUNG|nr:hypothetical protein DSO57_1028899 [Entomophthora muscae]
MHPEHQEPYGSNTFPTTNNSQAPHASAELGTREIGAASAAMTNNSKSAALNVTQLYREAQIQQKRSYKLGYEQCLQDMANYVNNQLIAQNQHLSSGQSFPFISLSDLENFTTSKLSQLKAYPENSASGQIATDSAYDNANEDQNYS